MILHPFPLRANAWFNSVGVARPGRGACPARPGRGRDRLPRGFLGLHASLLPKLRGGAPLNWAILSGLDETGVTLFQLEDGIDDVEEPTQGCTGEEITWAWLYHPGVPLVDLPEPAANGAGACP